MQNTYYRITIILCLITISFKSYSQTTFNGTVNNLWSNASNWSAGKPDALDAVTIPVGVNPVVDENGTCASISFTGGNANSSLTVNSGFTLSVTGNIVLNAPNTTNMTHEFIVGDGTVTCAGLTMANTTGATYKNRLSIGNGQITISTTFTLSGGAAGENELVFTGSGSLIYNGATFGLSTNDTYTSGTGTIQLGRSGAVTLPAGITYHNIILAGNNTKTITNTTINKLTINSGVTATCGNNNLTVNDTLLNNGTLTITSTTGTKSIRGVFINNGTFTNSANEAIEFRGGLQNNGTFTPGSGIYSFTTNSQDINGSNSVVFAGAVTISSPAVVNNYDSVVVPGTFTISSGATWRNQANSQLNLTGTATLTGTMNCDGANNTVYFNSTNAQSSSANAVYVNLSKTTSNTLTLGSNTTISGRLLINTGTIAMGANTITVGGSLNGSGTITQSAGGILNIGGNNLHSGTHTISTGTVNYNGSTDQTVRNLTYNNLEISGSGIKSLNGNSTVSATLTLTAGSLDINGNLLTINGTVTRTAGFIRGSTTSNLTVGGAAAAASLFFDQTNQASRSLSNLTNTRANGITISNALEIVDSINVSNGTITSGGNITLVSTASKTARIARIVNGGVSGDVVAQRFIPGGAGKRKWRFLSSPVNTGTGITLTQYIDDIHVTGMGGSANGFDNCTCLPSIRFYNETLNAIADSGWRNPATINYQVNTGFAVEVFVRGSRSTPDPFLGTSVPDNATIDYVGSINSGAININLSFTNNGISNSDGFNLVGNPYPSQIDWMASGWTKTNIDRFFWSYNPDASNPIYGGFDPNSGLGTNGVTRFIPSGMGFFVKANNTGAQLGFSETVKSTGSPYNFFKSTASAPSKFPHIRVVAGDSLISDETILLFDSSATASNTDLSDIMKLFNPTINFYSKSKENRSLAFNQIPFPSNIKEDTINFSMFVFKDTSIRVGAYNMYLKELVDIPSWLGVDVLDRFTNIRTDIKNNPYHFNIENKTGSHGNNRLALILYKKTTGIEYTTKQFGIYPNPAQKTINISNYNNSIKNIKIFDMKSSLVKEIIEVNQSIDVSDLVAGLYLIQIQTNNGLEIHKTIIQK